MCVGTWGYGTGATTSAAHPFSLCIQGVDVIDAVPIESISVSQSVSGNATLTFSIYDAAGTMAVPEGWADVAFSEHTTVTVTGAFDDGAFDDGAFDTYDAAVYTPYAGCIFGGLIMGVTVRLDAVPSRWIDVRCVDYGILLDVTPMPGDVTFASGAVYDLADICQAIAGASPLGGMTAIAVDSVLAGVTPPNATGGVSTGGTLVAGGFTCTGRKSVRAAIDEVIPDGSVFYSLSISPLRELTIVPDGYVLRNAPQMILYWTSNTGSEQQIDIDYRPAESGVYVTDTYVDTPPGEPDHSGYHRGTINGYTVAPSTIRVGMYGDEDRLLYGEGYVSARRDGTWVGQVTVTSADTYQIYSSLSTNVPQLDLVGYFAITSVTTRFLGGLQRRSEIQFGGELGTVARFNRTRFARAGVTT